MATWDGLRSFILANYTVSADSGNSMFIDFSWKEDGRHQRVGVRSRGEIQGTDWASIETVVAKESQINPRDLLVRGFSLICGGFSILDTGDSEPIVLFGHSIPLADLDPSEFVVPLRIVAECGDEIEKELTGHDRF